MLLGSRFGDEINGFVLNFRQKEPFNSNNLVGLLPNGYPDYQRGSRADVKFHPAGAKTKEESRQLVSSKPKEDLIFQYPAGAVDPQPVYIILPDTFQDLPQTFKNTQYGDNPSLGAVMNKFVYSYQGAMEMLKINARQNPQRIKDMKETYMQSDLTSEENLDQVAKVVETVLNSVDNRNRT